MNNKKPGEQADGSLKTLPEEILDGAAGGGQLFPGSYNPLVPQLTPEEMGQRELLGDGDDPFHYERPSDPTKPRGIRRLPINVEPFDP